MKKKTLIYAVAALACAAAPVEASAQGWHDRQDRQDDRRCAAGRAQRTTISVHRATQRSRFASTSAGGSCSGSRGTIACFSNSSGSGTPARTG